MRSFLWMVEQAWSAVVYFWVVSIPLFMVACAAVAASIRRLAHSGWQTCAWLSAPFAMPLVVLTWGTAMGHTGASVAAPQWTSYVLGALLVVGVLLFTLCIWRSAGFRWLAFGLSLFAAWLTCCSAFVAGMSLANDWL